MRLVLVAFVCVFVAACTSSADGPFIYQAAMEAPPPDDATVQKIYVATTRRPSEDPWRMYSGERALDLKFGSLDVSIPPTHTPGQVEWPNGKNPNPAKEFVGLNPTYQSSSSEFVATIEAELARRAPEDRSVMIFVHGFNNNFAEAIFRFAQIVNDSGYRGVPVLFTWPSRGSSIDYLYDRDSAMSSRDALEQTLRLVASTDATGVDILAHSMGTWLTMESLRQIRISNDTRLENRLADVILAAPDINIDVFKSQMRRYGRPDRPFVVLVSRDDRALAISRRISGGGQRVGGYDDDQELADLGLVVIDISGVDSAGDRTNHSKFASNPALVRLLGSSVRADNLMSRGPAKLDEEIVTFGNEFGNFVGELTGLVITTPVRIVTSPASALPPARSRRPGPTR